MQASPFPGMDPYLERYWGDVHHRLTVYACDYLQPQLPDSLRARSEERVFVEAEDGPGRWIRPDVYVTARHEQTDFGSRTVADGNVAVAEPLVIEVADEPITQGYIEIIDVATGNRVVTVIEFISPSNKTTGDGQELYAKKQRECREAAVNLVEIDLTRSGQRELVLPMARIPPSHRTTYQVCVWRATRSLGYEIYPVPLTDRLPTIRIPLRPDDPDVPLDLQALVDQAYHNGRYDDLDYKSDPYPSLTEADAKWAGQLLRDKGLR